MTTNVVHALATMSNLINVWIKSIDIIEGASSIIQSFLGGPHLGIVNEGAEGNIRGNFLDMGLQTTNKQGFPYDNSGRAHDICQGEGDASIRCLGTARRARRLSSPASGRRGRFRVPP